VFIVGTRPMHQAKHQPNFRSASPAYFSVLTMLTTEYLHIPNMQRRDTEKLLELELDVTKVDVLCTPLCSVSCAPCLASPR
jgi:hypothetical protein